MRSLVKPHTSPSPSSLPSRAGEYYNPLLEGKGEGEGALLMNSFVTAVINQAGVCRPPNRSWLCLLPNDYSAVFAFHKFELLFQRPLNRQRHKPLYTTTQGGDLLNNRCSQIRVFLARHHEGSFYL